MSDNIPDPEYRNYKMPPDELNRMLPDDSNTTPLKQKLPFLRINGEIHAREVLVIDERGSQIGVMPLTDAIALAKAAKLDLVEIIGDAVPPVCRIMDFGMCRYKLAKKSKKSD
jgi:translation initiation factor IF-3